MSHQRLTQRLKLFSLAMLSQPLNAIIQRDRGQGL